MDATTRSLSKSRAARTDTTTPSKHSELVRNSHAGNAFHFRWAARRCLRLLDFRSSLKYIVIEGSSESPLDGECAIDLAEYSTNSSAKFSVAYFQLKHSTVRAENAFKFSELKSVLEEFAKRFLELSRGRSSKSKICSSFNLITNRIIDSKLKDCLGRIRKGLSVDRTFRIKIETTTGLKGQALRDFCSLLNLVDDEGDYIVQKFKLHGEIEQYVAGFVNSPEVANLIELVVQRALPKSIRQNRNGEIHREDVLNRLEASSERSLFPADPELEDVPHVLPREQHAQLVKSIVSHPKPLLIHAEGGVGKSVVARQIANSLPHGSIGIVYDCFGGGKYRNASEPRHGASEALVQIANELARKGYCRTLICRGNTPINLIFRDFKERIVEASKSLKQINSSALIVLLVDAADNAEMVAADTRSPCFAKALLREDLSSGCRLVELCRTERIHLLDPENTVRRLELKPFSRAETAVHLRGVFPDASDDDALEFHRLTGGNARVQANALYGEKLSLSKTLTNLGPSPTTVAHQISDQLKAAIDSIKKNNTPKFQRQIEAICTGLANLPPFVPLEVLAKAANVDVLTIKSFVSDLKRPLWQSDKSVQFRDEPTETWFREKFSADPSQIARYVSNLEPLAEKFTYVAKALPQLLLKSENYDRLITLALSDKLLPKNNPIDERDVRVYRLQFAFRASLKVGRIADACRLAFRAGEEVAGDKRQLELLTKHSDLVAKLQDAHKVQELAYRRSLGGNWRGSNNVYSSSILSEIPDFKGEARGYLRAAEEWLRIYFEERAKVKEDERGFGREALNDEDLVEFAWTYRNLFGTEEGVKYLLRWNPPEVVFRLTRLFVARLVDAAAFEEVFEVARIGAKNAHLIVAVTDELSLVGRWLPQKYLQASLNSLCGKKPVILRPDTSRLQDSLTPAIISFAEACAAAKCPGKKIIRLLRNFVSSNPDRSIVEGYERQRRTTYFRALSLKLVLEKQFTADPAAIFDAARPQTNGASYDRDQEKREFVQIGGALLPWYLLRGRLIIGDPGAALVDLSTTRSESDGAVMSRYRQDLLPYEIRQAEFAVLSVLPKLTPDLADYFIQKVINHKEIKLSFGDRIDALYAAVRSPHLALVKSALEDSCSNLIGRDSTESPEERSGWYIRMARAVLPASPADASAYFDHAVEAASKFGDELVDRWEAIVSIANRTAESGKSLPEHAYRFIRCAEMVGNTVSREKHWDRQTSIRTMFRLHASGAFAAVSRWMDRQVGWFDRLIYAVANEATQTRALDPMVAWCFSGFLGCNADSNYLTACLKEIPDAAIREKVLLQGIRDMELEDAPLERLQECRDSLANLNLKSPVLDDLIATRLETEEKTRNPYIPIPSTNRMGKKEWDRLFKKTDLLNPTSVREALDVFEENETYRYLESFWGQLIKRIPSGRESEFLKVLPLIPDLSYTETGSAIDHIRRSWLNKASVKRGWKDFVVAVGYRHATELSNRYRLMYWIETYDSDESSVEALRDGIYQGLADAPYLNEADVFFGFISRAAKQLSDSETLGLLDFSLSRFEVHIPADFGDGPWNPWLKVPRDNASGAMGLIWSALGSPFAARRWEAAHCVRRLVEYGCAQEIGFLIAWMQKGTVDGFGARSLPFYSLNAKMFLLIGLARGAVENPIVLLPYAKYFSDVALTGMPHVFIQKTAATIALQLGRFDHKAYSVRVSAEISKVGRSQFNPIELTDRRATLDSPWHKTGTVDQSKQFHFNMDFERNWLGDLGGVFGISQKQVADLAREVAVDIIGAPGDGQFHKDPRQDQWNSLDYDRRYTSMRGDSYPYVDRLSFYHEYHALLSVAAKLLMNMPVAIDRQYDGDPDPWDKWFNRHYLTRSDHFWLCDRRDPCPIKRRAWTKVSTVDHWLWDVSREDFHEVLSTGFPLPKMMCIDGHWSDHRDYLTESISVASALVSPSTASSLAAAFRQSHPHDFRLPNYEEDGNEIRQTPFELVGWLTAPKEAGDRLDKFDPYAKGINLDLRNVGQSFLTLLDLTTEPDGRGWRARESGKMAIFSTVWSKNEFDKEDQAHRHGHTLVASVDLLRRLCSETGKFLIFDVQISRTHYRSRNSRSSQDEIYSPPSHKIFLFSPNGYLYDANKRYKTW